MNASDTHNVPAEPGPFFTIGETAEIFRVPEEEIRSLIQDGSLQTVQLPPRSGRLVISQEALEDFVRRFTV